MPSGHSNLEPGIRNAVRAVIVRDNSVLMLRKWDDQQAFRYALPGGAQESGETLAAALRRECLEEIGCEVQLGPLLLVADYFKRRNSEPPSYRQLIEYLFRCDVPSDYQPQNGSRPDKHQLGVAWMPRNELPSLTMTPTFLADFLTGDLDGSPRYTDNYADHADSEEYR